MNVFELNVSDDLKKMWNERNIKYLPVPNNLYGCKYLIGETQELLDTLDEEDDSYIDIEEKAHEAMEILESLTLENLHKNQISGDWKDDAKMWVFNMQVIATVQRFPQDDQERERLRKICKDYIELLNLTALELKE